MRQKNDALYGEIIGFVNNYFEENGRSPSTREIESRTGISRPTVQRYLKVLQEKGEISYDGHRGIVTEYMRELTNTNRLEMGNSIPCGTLTEVSDAELKHIRFPRELSGAGDFFLLRANGDSMIKAGIDSGDLVLIRMPKLKCPYGNHRFADVSDVKLRNCSELKKADEAPDADFILECPKCRKPVALCIKTLHEPVGVTMVKVPILKLNIF